MGKLRAFAEAPETVEPLPIPRDVKPSAAWPDSMIEMADHIGAYAAMLIVEKFGGLRIKFASDPELSAAKPVIASTANRQLSEIYGNQTIEVPLAPRALREARMGGVLADLRAHRLTYTDAVIRLRLGGIRVSVKQLAQLAARPPAPPKARAVKPARPAQLAMFEEEDS